MRKLLSTVSFIALLSAAHAAPIAPILSVPSGGTNAKTADQALANLYQMPTSLGAKCDATSIGAGTDDSAAFNASIAATSVIMLPPQKNCLVANLTIADNQILDCNGSILQPVFNANWVIKKTGFNSHIRNCVVFDPNWTTVKISTLTSTLAPGTVILPLASTANFQVNMIASIQLASGAYWVSKITAVDNVSKTITIADPIPYTLTGVSVNTAGTGYVATAASSNPSLFIDEGIIISNSGDGLPATVSITTSGGAITGATVDSPGMWLASPGATGAVFDPRAALASNGILNLTLGGANSGAFVDAAFGEVIDDNASDGSIENVTVSDAGVGFQILHSSGAGTTTSESIRVFNVNNATIAGFAEFANVSNNSFREVRLNGYIHHASQYGATGVYINGDGITGATGGNKWDVVTLGFEIGMLDINGTIETAEHVVLDTSRNAGLACFGCNGSSFSYLWASFTGKNASSRLGSIAGQGVGTSWGSSLTTHPVNNSISHFVTQANASDVHISNVLASIWIDNQAWSWTKFITGFSNTIQPGYQIMLIPTSSNVGGLSGTLYLAPGQVSATQNVGGSASLNGEMTTLFAGSSIAPGAATYTAFAYINHWNGTTYNGWNAYSKCTWTGTALGCTSNQSGAPIAPQDQLDVSVTISTGSFPTNQTLNASINGE